MTSPAIRPMLRCMWPRLLLVSLLLAGVACDEKPGSSEDARDDADPNSQQAQPGDAAAQAEGAGPISYSDTPEDLQRLFENLLAALQSGNDAEADRIVLSFRLPEAETWFGEHFPRKYPAKLAKGYKDAADQLPQLKKLLLSLIKKEQTNISVERFDDRDQPGLTTYQRLALSKAATKSAIALYSVRLSKPGEELGFHLWSFVHDGQTFRWVGKMFELSTHPIEELGDTFELRFRDRKRLESK